MALRIRARRSAGGLALLAALLAGAAAAPSQAESASARPRVIATPQATGPADTDDPSRFRVDVRNVGDAPTTAPVRVEVEAAAVPAGPGRASAWTCDAGGTVRTCTLSRTLGPGAQAPALALVVPARHEQGRAVVGDALSVTVLGSDAASSSATRASIRHGVRAGSDVALAMFATRTASVRAPARFAVIARNTGYLETPGPVAVALGAADVVSADGDGWSCDTDRSTCRTNDPIAPGATAPPLSVEVASAAPYLQARATGGGSVDDRTNDSVSDSARTTAASDVDLVASVEDAGRADEGGRGAFVARVRNVGTATSTGRITADLTGAAGITGDAVIADGPGWSCARGRCVADAAVGPGAEAPSLDVTVPAAPLARRHELRVGVSGGSDGDDRDDVASAIRPSDDQPSDTDVVTTLTAVPPGRGGDAATVQVAVRNPSADDRAAPTTVVVDSPFPVLDASGDGWSCTSEGRCRNDGPLAAGGRLPALELRLDVPGTDAQGPHTVTARPAGTAAGGPASASATFGVGGTPRDLIPELSGVVPPRNGERGAFTTIVRNAGGAPVPGPVRVELGHRATYQRSGIDASGDGWQCDDGHCEHPGPVAAHGTLPPIASTYEPVPDTDSSGPSARVTADTDTDTQNDVAYADTAPGGTATDLVPVITDVTPQVGPEPATAAVTVHEAGPVATPGPVVLRLGRNIRAEGGDGWTCGELCRYDGPVSAGGDTPPVHVTLPSSLNDTVGLEATVVPAADRNDISHSASVVVPATNDSVSHPLAVSVSPPENVGPTEPFFAFGTVVRTAGSTGGRVVVDVAASPGIVVDGIGLDDAVGPCEGVTRCVADAPTTQGTTLDVVVKAHREDGAPGLGTLKITASTQEARTESSSATTRVAADGAGPDVALSIAGAPPVTDDDTATYLVRARNGGGGPTDGPVTVELGEGESESLGTIRAVGPGWSCDDRQARCVHPDVVPAGQALPDLAVRVTHPGSFGDFDREVTAGLRASIATPGDVRTSNQQAYASAGLATRGNSGVVVAAQPVGGDEPHFDVRARNAGEATTTAPVVVRAIRGAAGDGWVCVPDRTTCRYEAPLEPGASAPVLRVPPEYVDPDSGRIGQGIFYTDTQGRQTRVAIPAASRSDLVVAASGPEDPHVVNGSVPFELRVANLGLERTSSPVELTFDDPDPEAPGRESDRTASGPGWTCPAGGHRCRLRGGLDAGESAPVLQVQVPVAPSATTAELDADVLGDGYDQGRPRNDTASAVTPVVPSTGASPRVVVTLTGSRPTLIGATHDLVAHVREVGGAPSASGVTVSFANTNALAPRTLTASGDGWQCDADACRRPGPVAADEDLPPISLRFRYPADVRNVGEPAELVASVALDGGRPVDSERATVKTLDGRPRGQRAVTLDGVRPTLPGERSEVRLIVSNDGMRNVDGQTELDVRHPFPSAVATGDGWDCDAALHCRTTATLTPGAALPPVTVSARTPSSGPETLSATVGPDASIVGSSSAAVLPVRGSFVDLVPRIDPIDPPASGTDSVSLVRVTNAGTRSAPGPTTIAVDGSALNASTLVDGDGWSCSGLRCTNAAPVAAGRSLPALRVTTPGRGMGGIVQMDARLEAPAVEQSPSNDVARVQLGVTQGGGAAQPDRSPYFSVRPATRQAAIGGTVRMGMSLAGLPPLAGQDADIDVRMPAGVRLDHVESGTPQPTSVSDRLRFHVRFPADGDVAALGFVARVDERAAGPVDVTSRLTSDALASSPRDGSMLELVRPRLAAVGTTSIDDDDPVDVRFDGDALSAADDYRLVRGDTVLRGTRARGGDRSVTVRVDPAGAPAGRYDAVVRRSDGLELRLAGAVEIAPRPSGGGTPGGGTPAGPGPGAPEGSGSGSSTTGGGSSAPATTLTPAQVAAIVAGQNAPPTAAPSPGSASAPAGTARVAGTLRPPTRRAFARSGWKVRVRASGAGTVTARLVADRATARALRVRTGATLGRATRKATRAGTTTLVVRPTRALRTRIRRARRVRGTLRLSLASPGRPTGTSARRVRLR